VRGVAVVRLSVEERVEVLQLYKQGLAIHQIAKEMSRSWWAVKAVLGATLPTEEYLYSPGPTRFSMVEREEIRAGLARGETFTAIAARLGRATSSISERSEEERRTGALPGLEALGGVPPALLAGQRWQSRWQVEAAGNAAGVALRNSDPP